jgi:3-oxoadipate CoA-transferase beta subunit
MATLECTPNGLVLIDLVDGLTKGELERLLGVGLK